MKHFATIAAFAASANALVSRAGNCCFQITASGGVSGDLGQLGDGQNRIGDSNLPPATYCIDDNGGITDESGRGCILTPPTTQLQCDEGASPTPGFSINSEGQIEYNGNTHFVACETGQNGGMNIYTSPDSGDVTGCKDVTLKASSCSNSGSGGAPGGASTPPAGGGGAQPSATSPGGGAGTGPSGAPGVSSSASVPGGGGAGTGPSGTPGVSPSGSVPGGGAGTGPSGSPSGSAPGGHPSGGPSGGVPSGPGAGTPTSVVSVATPHSSSSAPGGPGGGGGGVTPAPGSSSAPGEGGGVIKTTIRTTQTVAVCPETCVPGGPGAGTSPSGIPSVPGGGAGTGPSGTPSVPGGGAGTGPSGTPSGPGGGAGTGPSGTPSGPGGGAGTGPSGTPSGPGGGAGTGTPSGPGGGAGTQPSGTQGAGASCPTDLSGDYEYPHLIIPIDSSSPDNAPGTSLNGTVTDTVSSIFNFDIPNSDAGKTCSLVFLFPHLQDLETSSFSFSGDGKVDFALLDGTATSDTSYNNAPGVKKDLGDFTVAPGNSYLISTFKCPAGETVSYEMKNAGSTDLDFFEDYNPSPLGVYITVC